MTEILRLSLPISVWLVGFSGLYALQGLACSRHWPADLEQRPALLAACAVSLIVQIACLWWVRAAPSPSPFVQGTATALAIVALIAAAWVAMPVLFASVCL